MYTKWADDACVSCPGGQKRDSVSNGCIACLPGQFALANNKKYTCDTTCSVGKYSGAGSATCSACAAGKYNDKSGQAACIQCAKGQYQSQKTRAGCIQCAKGRYNNLKAKTSSSDCLVCAAGQYQGAAGRSSCINCEKGKYEDATAASECKLCKSGSYQHQLGRTKCTACSTKNPAWVSVPGATSREQHCVCGIDYGTCREPRGIPAHDWKECLGAGGACPAATYDFDVRRGRPGEWSYENPQYGSKRTSLKATAACSKQFYLYVLVLHTWGGRREKKERGGLGSPGHLLWM